MERIKERPPERIEPMPPAEEPTAMRGRPEARPVPGEPVVENRVQQNIFLQPIAAPSILGLYGFAGGTFVVAAGLIGWYTTTVALAIFPFAFFFGGLAQFLAGMFAYKARDGLATAMHGMWGAFWLSYGTLFLLIATGVVTRADALVALGFWFIPLATITLSGATAATRVSWALFAVLFLLGAGSAVAAAGLITVNAFVTFLAGWLFLFSAIAAWWTASGLMWERLFRGRTLLPLGERKARPAVTLGPTEPGVIRGQ